MKETSVHKVGLVITHRDAAGIKVLLAKTKPGRWSFPDAALPDAVEHCDKDFVEPLRERLNLGKTSFISNVFYRDSRDAGVVTRFFALKCASPEAALTEAALILNCETRWASFEEASWVVAAPQLEVSQWAERLVTQKTSDNV